LSWAATPGHRPPPPRDGLPSHQVSASGFIVLNLQLRPLPNTGSVAWGNLQLKVRTPPEPCQPPDPCTPVITLAGVIHNPAGETFTAGELVAQVGIDEATVLGLAGIPPQPCTRYALAGGLEVSAEVAEDFAGGLVSAAFYSVERPLGSIGGTVGVRGPAPGGSAPATPPHPCVVTLSGS